MPGLRGYPGGGAPFRRGLSVSEVEGAADLLRVVELDDLRETFFGIAWHQHGGSGLGVTIGELEEMRASDILWYVERVQRAREAEAEQMRRMQPRSKAARAPRARARARR